MSLPDITGRDKAHAELCALIDALLQQPGSQEVLLQQLIEPLAALQQEQRQLRARAVAASRVDFFTLVRGEWSWMYGTGGKEIPSCWLLGTNAIMAVYS